MSFHHHRPVNRRGWEAIRLRALVAAGRRCTRCGHAGKLSVHHPTPLSQGGTHDQAIVALCRVCHRAQHNPPDPAREEWSRFLVEEFSHVEVN